MPQQERTGWRDQWYSAWHRKIRQNNGKDNCYFMDSDWWEFGFYKNELVLLAYMELKAVMPNGLFPEPTEPQWKMIELMNSIGIPAFVLWYDKSAVIFYQQKSRNREKVVFTEQEWVECICQLHSVGNIKSQCHIQQALHCNFDELDIYSPSEVFDHTINAYIKEFDCCVPEALTLFEKDVARQAKLMGWH